MPELKDGDQAPDFSTVTSKGEAVNLADLKGKNVVLYFYPKDDTPGCTVEAKEFTTLMAQFDDKDTKIFGVSYDDAQCHQDFIKKYDLSIDLLLDEDHKIAEAYQSAGDGYANRNTFLIDKEGKIKKVFWNVNPEGHALEVLSYL